MMDNEHKITLDSGISFDFTNLFGVDRLTPEDVKTMHEKIAAAQETIKHLRQTGEIAGHLSKDGTPEHVYFTRLPYVQEGYPNTKELLDSMIGYGQTKEARDYAAKLFEVIKLKDDAKVKALSDMKDIVAPFGMESYQDYIKHPTHEVFTKENKENLILDIISSIMSSPYHRDEATRFNNFEVLQSMVQDFVKNLWETHQIRIKLETLKYYYKEL